MGKIFFTSDLHFSHKNVIKYCQRPFEGIAEMERILIENWNSVVGPQDTVYVLGDVFFCGKQRAEDIIKKLNGYKILVKGNHDWPTEKMKTVGFNEAHKQLKVELLGHHIKLCHFPFRPMLSDIPREVLDDMDRIKRQQQQTGMDRMTELDQALNNWAASGTITISQAQRLKSYDMRFLGDRFENDGSMLLCGHVHEKWLKKDSMVNVGVDVWDFKPVPIEKLLEVLKDPRPFIQHSRNL